MADVNRKAWYIGLLAIAVGVLFAVRLLVGVDWNPSGVIRFGEVFTHQNEHAERLLGEVSPSAEAGHDGKFFFWQALDPFYIQPDVYSVHLDRPSYRAQRMLYPLLASAGGILPARATAWGLIVVNIAAIGIGTVYTARVAESMGISAWFGLAFTFNPGVLEEASIDGGGVVALAALMAGVYHTRQGKLGLAAIALTAAGLARETMLISAAGLAFYVGRKRRQIPWQFAMPVLAVGGWWFYLRSRLDGGASQDLQAVDLPGVGFYGALESWMANGDLVSLGVSIVMITLCALVLWKAREMPTELGWAAAGFSVLALLMSEPVWYQYFDSTRALAPVVTAYIVVSAAALKSESTSPRIPIEAG